MEGVFNKYFSVAEEKLLFATIKKTDCIYAKRDYYWMLLVRETAIRLGILAGPDSKKAKDKDLPQIGLTIGDALDSLHGEYLVYKVANNKRNKKHPIHLNKSARAALKALIDIHRKMSVNWVWKIPVDERPLVLGRNRCKPMGRRTYQLRMTHWCKQAGVPQGSVHWLRHTWAKRFLQRSSTADAILRVKAVLGHESINTSALYTLPDKEEVAEAMQQASTCRK